MEWRIRMEAVRYVTTLMAFPTSGNQINNKWQFYRWLSKKCNSMHAIFEYAKISEALELKSVPSDVNSWDNSQLNSHDQTFTLKKGQSDLFPHHFCILLISKTIANFFPNKIIFMLQKHCHCYKTNSMLTYTCTYVYLVFYSVVKSNKLEQ